MSQSPGQVHPNTIAKLYWVYRNNHGKDASISTWKHQLPRDNCMSFRVRHSFNTLSNLIQVSKSKWNNANFKKVVFSFFNRNMFFFSIIYKWIWWYGCTILSIWTCLITKNMVVFHISHTLPIYSLNVCWCCCPASHPRSSNELLGPWVDRIPECQQSRFFFPAVAIRKKKRDLAEMEFWKKKIAAKGLNQKKNELVHIDRHPLGSAALTGTPRISATSGYKVLVITWVSINDWLVVCLAN